MMIMSQKKQSHCSSGIQTSVASFSSHSLEKYGKNHPKQQLITEGILKMVVKDLRPSSIVQYKGFKDLLEVLNPCYTVVSRQHLQYSLIPKQVHEATTKIKLSLQNARFCSVTLDIWSSRRMHAYLGVTCHILIECEIVSYLLACWQILAAHTGKNILADFEEIVHDFQLDLKFSKAITDNASNMKKAFAPISLPGFVLADSDESVDKEDHNIEEESGISIDEHEDHNQDLPLDVLQLAH